MCLSAKIRRTLTQTDFMMMHNGIGTRSQEAPFLHLAEQVRQLALQRVVLLELHPALDPLSKGSALPKLIACSRLVQTKLGRP